MLEKNKRNLPLLFSLLILLIYLSPNIFLMDKARFLIHDNLDSNIVWYKTLANSHLLFANSIATFPNMFDGIPRGCMPSQFSINMLLYSLFSPLVAYNLNIVILHLVAFAGMFLFLNTYVFKNQSNYHSALIAVSFAVLPFWPSGFLSIAGQPLIIWCFLNLLYGKKSLVSWLTILLYPLYSDLIFSGLFFSIAIFVLIAIFCYKQKKLLYKPLLALIALNVMWFLVEYRLILMSFVYHLQTQRDSFIHTPLNFKGYLGTSLLLFLKGQYHCMGNQWPIIVISSLLALFLVGNRKQLKLLGILFLFGLVFSCVANFSAWGGSQKVLNMLGGLKSFQWRFYSLLPMLWYTIFALSIYFITEKFQRTRMLTLGIIFVSIIMNMFEVKAKDYLGSDFNDNSFYYSYFGKVTDREHLKFSDYYSPTLFDSVKNKIGYKTETVLCLGFSSELAMYNDFNTAAAYYAYFPEEKKQELVSIFKPELDKIKDNTHREEVINSRRFQFYYNNYSPSTNEINDLSLNQEGLNNMHIKYILSFPAIKNYATLRLDSVTTIKNPSDSFPSQVNVYRVNF